MAAIRARELLVGKTQLKLPCFFPSVSSIKTNLMPVDYLELLDAAAHPLFLVSAFDIAHCGSDHIGRLMATIERSKQRSSIILLDSGNYESFWKGDLSWTVEQYHTICQSVQYDLCFCYDNQTPPDTVTGIVEDVERIVIRDQERALGTVVPIVHGPVEALPLCSKMVAERLCPMLIAIPERTLGDGIFARIRSVRRIRTALDELPFYCPLHLLGTGNPIGIAAYAMAGADSFDGLEWCQTVIDHETGKLLHFHQWDFVRRQTKWGDKAVLPYIQSALMHNLEFYSHFMDELRAALVADKPKQILDRYASKRQTELIIAAVEGDS